MIDIEFFSKLFFLTFSCFFVGAVGSLVFLKNDKVSNWWSHLWAAAGSLAGIVLGGSILMSGQTFTFQWDTAFEMLTKSIRIDSLAALFVLLISVISLVASVYGLGYMDKFYNKYSLGSFGFFYNIFLASLLMVVTAYHGFYFLIVWEIMSLASYFLVIFEHDDEENVRSGTLYLIMTHVGTAFIMFGFLLLYRATGSLDFGVMATQIATIPDYLKQIVFVSLLIGFGTKAGIIPLHVWLPKAHPAAPTHVSALMSGVMIKTAIFMLFRLLVDVMGGGPLWWGVLILILGAISSLLGVLYALSEHDIKRLLAYHSVENIGIILLGLGSGLIFWSLDVKPLAMLGFAAALYHTVNHAVFKALLFLGAGSVVYRTHTRNIEEYGGLIKKMPYTAVFFLVGAIAISGLPPFNGFASEWSTFQAMFGGFQPSFSVAIKGLFLLAIGALAFTSGLAAACFVKAFGTTFLAKPRSQEVEHATETSGLFQFGMAVLALLCLGLGIFSYKILPRLVEIVKSLADFSATNSPVVENGVKVWVGNGFLALPLVVVGLLIFIAATAIMVWLVSRKQKTTIYQAWDCGVDLTPRMEITATGFSQSLISMFKAVLKPSRQTEIDYKDSVSRYFAKSWTVHMSIRDIYWIYFYHPLFQIVGKISEKTKQVQSGVINAYLLYIFITLIGLLVWVSR